MSEDKSEDANFTRMVVGSVAITMVLLLILPMIFVAGKSTYYSAYTEGEGGEISSLAQVTDMRETMANDEGYFIANTMSTPMLVNDWRDPHRTALMIIGPEKPIAETEADAIYDFVTNRGGKVIVAADGTNANRLAEKFGVTFFDSPLNDENQYWMEYTDGQPTEGSWLNVWGLAAVTEDVNEMPPSYLRQGCIDTDVLEENRLNCRLPVMFRSPTGMKFEPLPEDDPNQATENQRQVKILSTASPSAFIDVQGNGLADDQRNPAPGDLALIIRIDYPGITTFDKVSAGSGGLVGGNTRELQVTGSIVFVSDEEAFSNRLWNLDVALENDMSSSCEQQSNNCWLNTVRETYWQGNEQYFSLLIDDMMEHDNRKLAKSIRDDKSQFQIVFDESRHVTGIISAPFVETMGTVVLLTSNTFLKWLVVLNVGLLLLVAMMVVPEKENWRHIFDLTRFKERPNKLDSSSYRQRVQKALFTKVRVHHDLTRDQMAIIPPAEFQTMIGDPRLVELAYSQSRKYTPQELRQLMVAIRRWGKN